MVNMVKMESKITSFGTPQNNSEKWSRKFVLKSLIAGNYLSLVHKREDFNTKLKTRNKNYLLLEWRDF